MNFEFVKAYFWNRTSCFFFNHSHNHSLFEMFKSKRQFPNFHSKSCTFCLKREKEFCWGRLKKNGKLILRKFCLSYTYTIDFKHVKKPKENLSIKNFNRTRMVKHCYGVLRLERKKFLKGKTQTLTHTYLHISEFFFR